MYSGYDIRFYGKGYPVNGLPAGTAETLAEAAHIAAASLYPQQQMWAWNRKTGRLEGLWKSLENGKMKQVFPWQV